MAIHLNRREKMGIIAAAAVIAAIIAAQFILTPVMAYKKRLTQQVEAKTGHLREIQTLTAQYRDLQSTSSLSQSRFTRRPGNFTLFSYLNRLVTQAGIKDNIAYMKPSSQSVDNSPLKLSRVEMKVQAITTEQLVNYLYRVETSRNMIFVRKMSVTKAGKDKPQINAILQIETYEQ